MYRDNILGLGRDWSKDNLQVRQSSVLVALVPVPRIIIKWVLVSQGKRLVDSREDDLVANYTPCGTTLRRLGKFITKPVLLSRSHQSPASIIGNRVDIVSVP